MTRTRIGKAAALAALMVSLFPWGAVTHGADSDKADNYNMVLTLEQAVRNKANLLLEFEVRDGEFQETAWGEAVWYNRSHHYAKVKSARIADGKRVVSLDVTVQGDPWVPGAKGPITLTLQQEGKSVTGTYEGKLGEVDVSGKVRGHVGPAWPMPIRGVEPARSAEHPKLIFRKSERDELRRRATETPQGKAILDRTLKMLDAKFKEEADKRTNWPAVGYGFAWQMTGEKKYADKAREIIRKTMFENPAGRRGQGIGQDIHHAPRLQGLALAYDLCYDAWDADFRAKVVGDIQQRVRELRAGKFQGRKMSGFNPNWWSNHNGIRAACMGLGALAVIGEKNADGKTLEDAEQIIAEAARGVRMYYTMGVSQSGWNMEGAFYKVMTMRRGLVHFVQAYNKTMGLDLLAGPAGDFDMVNYFMEMEPGKGWPKLDGVIWTADLVTVPDDMMPGVKYILDRAVGLQGRKTFGIDHTIFAPYALANYPFEVDAVEPGESLRWMAPDPRKGHYVFRPTLQDRNDVLLVLNLKSRIFGGCHYERSGEVSEFHLHGSGVKWIEGTYLPKVLDIPARNELHGPVVVAESDLGDKSYAMDMVLDRAYYEKPRGKRVPKGAAPAKMSNWDKPYWDHGIRGRRSMIVDCSGKSGFDVLIAMRDVIEQKTDDGSKPIETRWRLPLQKKAGKLEIEGQSFTVTADNGATLSGVLLADAKLGRIEPRKKATESDVKIPDWVKKSKNIKTDALPRKDLIAQGTDPWWVVFGVSDGKPVPIEITGSGKNTAITVGKRKITVRDGSLHLE
ncbi:MAG: hypothetical protein ACLFV7_12045 [Phycisphaerae bacterium]